MEIADNKIRSVRVDVNGDTQTIAAKKFVSAAGPLQKNIAAMLGVDLPVECEIHMKVMLNDPKHVIPRHMGLTIWNDPVYLPWTDDERAALTESEETRWLTEELPSAVHGRPEGEGDMFLMQWVYEQSRAVEPVFPVKLDAQLPELALRGMANMIPGLSVYFDSIPKPSVDGGYYARTPENRLLSGPLAVEGAYIIGGLGGFGMMSSCGAADVLAKHIAGAVLPDYAPMFALSRYNDPAYQELLKQWGASGQI